MGELRYIARCGSAYEVAVAGSECAIAPARDDQVLMPARLDDPAVVEHDDLIRIPHR
jgi:hypothetical protein